jgi:hypothetical protein
MPWNNRNANSAVGLEEAPEMESEEALLNRIRYAIDEERPKPLVGTYEIKSLGYGHYRVNILHSRYENKNDLFPTISRPLSYYVSVDEENKINIQ